MQQIIALWYTFGICTILVSFIHGSFIKRRPNDGIGKLMISEDTEIKNYNKNRLMIFFDSDCLNKDNNNINNIKHNRFASFETHDHTLNEHKQQSKLSQIISTDTSDCLSEINDNNKHNFQISNKNNNKNIGISFLNINNKKCIKKKSFESNNIILNYNNLCIDMITYEPLLNKYSTSFGDNYTQLTTNDFNCITLNTNSTTQWHLDQIDSSNQDTNYSFPNITYDNGVDLYIIDSGIDSNHGEFYDNQVIHVLGNGPSQWSNSTYSTHSSHGTHVAGTAGGKNYGMSRNLTIYDYQVCVFLYQDYPINVCPTYLTMVSLDSIMKKLKNNNRRGVINLSLGGARSSFEYISNYFFDQIVDNGGIVVAAAGNSDMDSCHDWPSYIPSVIAVGASDSNLEKAWFSNYGNCVDIWAPGRNIFSSIPEDKYAHYQGTSMASPAIAGIIANLLWVDPTLTKFELLNILLTDSNTITGDECDTFTCKQVTYDCHTLPSNVYTATIIPAPTEFNSDTNYTSSVYVLPTTDDLHCNYVASGKINFDETDSEQYNSYFVWYLNYHIVDKCLAYQFKSNQTNQIITNKISYLFECKDDTTVEYKVWNNITDCNQQNNGIDYAITKTIKNGMIDGDDWYTVDCSHHNNENNNDESLFNYDESDCDIIARSYYFDDIDCTGYDDESILENLQYDDDYQFVAGACIMARNTTYGYSYKLNCDNNIITYHLYNGIDCNEDNFVEDGIYGRETCYSGLYFKILECSNQDTQAPTSRPTQSPDASIILNIYNSFIVAAVMCIYFFIKCLN